jgi:hypothetical protein
MERLRDYIRGGQVNKLRADAQAEREPLPAGKHRLELVNGVLVETADEDLLELEWKVETGEHAGRRVFQKLRLAGRAMGYSIDDLDLIGVPLEALDSRKLPKLPADANRPGDRFRAPVPVGIVVGVLIGHWTGTDGQRRHRIERLVKVLKPAPDLAEFEPEPPTVTAAGTGTAAPDRDQGGEADADEDGNEDYPGVEWEEGPDDGSVPF